MKIDFNSINREEFNIREQNGLFLINPRAEKHRWNLDELHLRSLICKEDGEIVSSGLPKFFNLGECQEHDEMFYNKQYDRIMLTKKIDGSLLIRDVIDGKVNFRTRGSFDLSNCEVDDTAYFIEQYPILSDPNFCPAVSLLFEWTTPDNQIIIKYDKPELTYIGMMVLHAVDSYPYFVPHYHKSYFPSTPIVNLSEIDEVPSWVNEEGVVAYMFTGLGVTMLKFKSDWYKRLHSIKYHFTKDELWMDFWKNNITTFDGYKDYLFELGMDAEVAEFHRDTFDDYIKNRAEATRLYFFYFMYIMSLKENSDSRKEQMQYINELTKNDKEARILCTLLLDNKGDGWLNAKILGISRPHYNNLLKEGLTKNSSIIIS